MLRGLVFTPFALALGLLLSLDDARASAGRDEACPAQCDACDEGTCRIECGPGSPCAQETVMCPSGMDCEVSCNGDAACRSATIVGPIGHELAVECNGADSCDAAVLDPGRDLELSCSGDDACSNATLHCGSGSCDWACVTTGSCHDIAVE
ncbi:MAG: hypothetical protein IAG13_17805 [Deltaproteobacteria bacterium]|nr:hypothetical protein [Nannocystaceae bacterium]